MIKFVRPTFDMIESIAEDMRQADADEVWASNRHTPLQSLMKGWENSHYSTVAMCNGQPLVMIGLVRRDLITERGVVWMLGANKAMKYRRDFLLQTKPIIDEMLVICSYLYNMVYIKNTRSIQWLKRLGFTVDNAIPYGPAGEMFHPFYLER